MNAYSKTISWWDSKSSEGNKWESLSEEQKVQAAWDASLALRADIVDIQALQWACQQIESLYNSEVDESKKRVINIYLDRLEKVRLACMAFK